MKKTWNRGIYTDRKITWELKNLWFLPLPFISCGMLSFFPVFYMGIVGKKTGWTILGLLFALMTFGGLSIISFYKDAGGASYILGAVLSIFFSFYFCKEFLQRLDLISKGHILSRIKKYDYRAYNPEIEKISQDIIRMKKIENKAENPGLDFILDLHRIDKELESESLRTDIRKIISVSELIIQKDKNTGDLFFERNAETVNKLLKKYNELEDTRINTPEIKENMKKIESTLNQISTAFEQELSNMYQNDLLDINAEAEAFIQSLKNRGLLDENNNKNR